MSTTIKKRYTIAHLLRDLRSKHKGQFKLDLYGRIRSIHDSKLCPITVRTGGVGGAFSVGSLLGMDEEDICLFVDATDKTSCFAYCGSSKIDALRKQLLRTLDLKETDE